MSNYIKFFICLLGFGVHAQILSAQTEELIEIISIQQELHVGLSCTEPSGYKDTDLQKFNANDTVNKIMKELSEDSEFINLVSEIKKMPEVDKKALLKKARSSYQPTWRQNNHIDCKGQSKAGQSAQKRISFGIVGLIKKMLKS